MYYKDFQSATFNILNNALYLQLINDLAMDIQHGITGEVYFVTDTVVDWVDIFTRPL